MAEYNSEGKTIRVLLLSITVIILGLFLLLFKAKWCESKPEPPSSCNEQFIEMTTSDYTMNVKCSEGARVEMVSSPPAPKAGIFCRCSKQSTPSASASQ